MRRGERPADEPKRPRQWWAPQMLHHYFALALILALVSFCGCSPAKSPIARETVRGAITGTASAVEYATRVCAKTWAFMDEDSPEAKRLFATCKNGWDDAEQALEAADKLVDTWDAAVTAPKVACLAGRALSALQATVNALDALGIKMDAALRATIDDGLALARWLVAMAPGGTCALPKVEAAGVGL